MATSATPVLLQKPQLGLAQITTASSTSAQTLFTGDADGSKVVGIIFTSNDTVARNVIVNIDRSGTSYQLGAISVPLGSGTNGSAVAVSAFSSNCIDGLPIDQAAQRYLFLASTSDAITIATTATITAGKVISAFAIAGDF